MIGIGLFFPVIMLHAVFVVFSFHMSCDFDLVSHDEVSETLCVR